MINRRPNSFALNLRIDIRVFAMIAQAYHKRDNSINTIGTFARLALEDYAKVLVDAGMATDLQTVDEANDVLEEMGVKRQQRGMRANRDLLLQAAKERGTALKDHLNVATFGYEQMAEPTVRPKVTPEDIMSILESQTGMVLADEEESIPDEN